MGRGDRCSWQAEPSLLFFTLCLFFFYLTLFISHWLWSICVALCVSLVLCGPPLELVTVCLCGSRLLLWHKGRVILISLERICFVFQPKVKVNLDIQGAWCTLNVLHLIDNREKQVCDVHVNNQIHWYLTTYLLCTAHREWKLINIDWKSFSLIVWKDDSVASPCFHLTGAVYQRHLHFSFCSVCYN